MDYNNSIIFFSCDVCKYFTNNKKDYNRHLLTKKHSLNTEINMDNKPESIYHICECGKKYLHRSSLNNHKKKCTSLSSDIDIDKKSDIIISSSHSTPIGFQDKKMNYDEMITTLINENKELRKVLVEQSKLISNVIPKIGNNHHNINSNNVNKFNINLFLNEQCKDAISMDNFIESIEVSMNNLMLSKEKGLAEGISNLFIENINKLPITQRPLHCTDVKRETLYIKNEKWEKDEKKEKTKHAIKRVSNLQASQINHVYINENPDYMKNDKKKDEYIHIVRTATGDIQSKEDKILKNICKEVIINEKILEKNN